MCYLHGVIPEKTPENSASAGVIGPDATLVRRCRPLRLAALSFSAVYYRRDAMKALSQDEILKVLRAARDNPRDLAMILIAFRHGMRASEVCGLEVKDVDMKNGEITIRRLKGSLKTTQPLADLQGQPLLSEKRLLRAWLTERGDHPSRYVFVSQKSGKVHRSQFYRIFANAAEQAGLPKDKRHPHCLKHSLGVTLVEANVNLAVIKQALGHKSIASTAVYTVPTDQSEGKAVTAAFASVF